MNLINEQPVRFNVALTSTIIVTCEIMIPIFCIQRTAIRQNIDYLKQFIQILVLILCKLQILFKPIGKLHTYFILQAPSSTHPYWNISVQKALEKASSY